MKRKEESIIKRTYLVENKSNILIAKRETSIYAGITIAQYFRNMEYNLNMITGRTSRWKEAIREILRCLAEMLVDAGIQLIFLVYKYKFMKEQ